MNVETRIAAFPVKAIQVAIGLLKTRRLPSLQGKRREVVENGTATSPFQDEKLGKGELH